MAPLQRINVNLQIILKETPEVLQNTAGQLRIIFFVEQLKNTRHAQNDANALARPPGEISGEPVVLEVIRDEDGHAAGCEDLGACEEISAVYFRAACQQIAHRQFHKREDGLVRHCGVFFKLRQSALQHIEVDVGDRTKTAALDENGLVMQHVGRLQHLAVRAEHGGAAQPHLHELERHDAVVHVAKLDSAELEHVDLDATRGEIIKQRFDEFLRHMT